MAGYGNFSFDAHIGDNTPVIVNCEWDGGQDQINYPNDSAQPGIPPSVEITSVLIGEDDIKEHLNEMCMDMLEDLAWKEMEDDEPDYEPQYYSEAQ